MVQKNSIYKVLQVFFQFPLKDIQMREISRKIKLAQASVLKNLKILQEEELIIRRENGIYPSYKANRDNELFRLYKKLDLMEKIETLGLLDYTWDKCTPACIILFGSASRGEDIENSDIDLFVQSPDVKLDLRKYNELFDREITVFFEPNFSKLSKELKNNIINGTKLKGYLKVF